MWDVRLIGWERLYDPCGRPVSLRARRADALLAALALEPGRPVGRERLSAMLWPGRDRAGAALGLRQSVHALRRATTADLVLATEAGLALNTKRATVDLDRASSMPEAWCADAEAGAILAGLRAVGPHHIRWLAEARRKIAAGIAEARGLGRFRGAAEPPQAPLDPAEGLALPVVGIAVVGGGARVPPLLTRLGAKGIAASEELATGWFGTDALRGSALSSLLRQLRAALTGTADLKAAVAPVRLGAAGRLPDVSRAQLVAAAAGLRPGTLGVDPALEPSMEDRPFVGRDTERAHIALIPAAVERERRLRGLIVTGPPGIGKSRLVTVCLEGLGPLVTSALRAGDVVAALAASHGASAREGDPLTHLAQSVRCSERARVLVIEDAEALDDVGRRRLSVLIARLADTPTLLVLCLRDCSESARVAAQTLARAASTVELHLGPLSAQEASTLAAAYPDDAGARAAAIARAGGNPLFLHELLTRPGGAELQAGSAEEAILARLGTLPSAAGSALRLLAILGDGTPSDLLSAMTPIGADALDALVTERFARHQDGGLAVAHSLMREAILVSTPPETRRSVHARAASLLTPRDRGRAAFHLAMAGDRAAGEALLSAAQAANRAGDPQRALVHATTVCLRPPAAPVAAALSLEAGKARLALWDLDGAETALRGVLERTLDRELRAEAHLGLAAVARIADRAGDGLSHLDAAETFLPEADKARRARANVIRGRLYFALGRIAASAEAYDRARVDLPDEAERSLSASILGGLGDVAYARGAMAEACAFAEQAIEACASEGEPRRALPHQAFLAHALQYAVSLDEASALAERTADMAEQAGDARAEINARLAIASHAFVTGNVEKAGREADTVISLATRAGAARFVGVGMLYKARCAIAAGEREAASRLLATLPPTETAPALHGAQTMLLSALSGPDHDLVAGLEDAVGAAVSDAYAHGALRVLPVAALAFADMEMRDRSEEALRLLNRLPCAWARLHAEAIRDALGGAREEVACQARILQFHRLAKSLEAPYPGLSDRLVC